VKNKKATYLLIALVVFIWGTIVFKIIKHVGPSDIPEQAFQPVMKADSFFEKDSVYQLNLKYSDPFLKGSYSKPVVVEQKQSRTNTNIRRRIKPQETLKQKIPVTWPGLGFSGNIINDKTGEQLGLLIIDNDSYLFRKGETRFGITLLELYNDSIKVEFEKEIKTIIKEKS
jgi:hypothetical protein